MTAEERYVFARRDGTYEIRRRTLLGDRTVVSGTLDELCGVQAAWVGHDDSILGVAVRFRCTESAGLSPHRQTGDAISANRLWNHRIALSRTLVGEPQRHSVAHDATVAPRAADDGHLSGTVRRTTPSCS